MSNLTTPAIQQPATQATPTTTNSTVPKVAVKNWKTTTIGFVLCCSGFVVFSPSTFGGEQAPLVQVCKYITSGGLAALGITAKDSNITVKNKNLE